MYFDSDKKSISSQKLYFRKTIVFSMQILACCGCNNPGNLKPGKNVAQKYWILFWQSIFPIFENWC